MNNEYTELPEYSKDDLDRTYGEALAAAEQIHQKLASFAEDLGYVVRVVSDVKPQLDWLYLRAQYAPSMYPIVASGIDFLRVLSSELNRLSNLTDAFAVPLGSIINSIATFGGTIDASALFFDPAYEPLVISPPPHRKTRDYYSAKLRELNATLANTYDQVWQTYFATTSEPHRAALFMMRTLFDNFFAWLAPDEKVRNSHHWHKKTGEKPNQIWRRERLAYAAEKHIKDSNRRTILETEANQINALYEAANEAHNRGTLDEEKASRTLMAMDNFLKDWLDSLT